MLVFLAVLIVLPELLLSGADAGFWGDPRWRNWAYRLGAFRPDLLDGDGRAAWPFQPWAMFATYGLLHAGIGHMLGNLAGLLWLGRLLLPGIGPWRFGLVFALALPGGAAMFAALAQGPAQMVGASGAIFGLAGAWVVQEWRLRRARPGPGTASASAWAFRLVGMLALLNAIVWVLQDGQLAWEAHLGGALSGALAMAAMRPRR